MTTNNTGQNACHDPRLSAGTIFSAEELGLDDVTSHPDGTVSFSESGRAWWNPQLAKIGIDIDAVKTRDDWWLALELSIRADTDTKSGMVELAAIITLEPVERATLERKAAVLRVKERRDAMRVVAGTAAHRKKSWPMASS